MGNIIALSSHPRHDPTRIDITSRLLRMGNAIKRDISRIMALSSKEPSDKNENLISNARKRIFLRLESIVDLSNIAKSQ
jgi:hypothetical protein